MYIDNKLKSSIAKYLNISKDVLISIGIYYDGKMYKYTLNKSGIVNITPYFHIGSISKTITAHLALKLINEGLIDINKPIDYYLKLKKGSYPTIYELLTHTDGYSKLSPLSITLKGLLAHNYSKSNIYSNITNKNLLKHIKPNKRDGMYHYSDLSYAVLAIIIEEVTKKSFDEVALEFIHKDLSMINTNTTYNVDSSKIKSVLNKKLVKAWSWNKNNPYIASGGFVSNINDMLKYVTILVDSNDSFIKDAFNKVKLDSKIVPAIGWLSYKGGSTYFHIGGVGCQRASIILNRKRKIGVVALGNTKGSKGANIHHISNQIYGDLKRHKLILEKEPGLN